MLRDWTRLTFLRTNRWQARGTAPRPASIGRTVKRPTLRLFGAGARPGPSTATALPRSLPLTLRLKPPVRPIGPPMLTLQSALPTEVSPAAQPETVAPVAPVEPEAHTAAPAAPAPKGGPPSLVSKALRIFRKPAPAPEPERQPAAPPQPAPEVEAAPAEQARTSLETPVSAAVTAAGDRQSPSQPRLALRRAAATDAEPGPPVPPTAMRRMPEPEPAPQAPVAAPAWARPADRPAAPASARVQVQPAPAAPPARPAPRRGVFYTLRRALRRDAAPVSPAERRPDGVQPAPARAASEPSAPASSPAVQRAQAEMEPGGGERGGEIAARTPAGTVEAGPARAQAAPSQQVVATSAMPASPRAETETRPAVSRPATGQGGGLFFTLRRLFRPQRDAGAESGTTRHREASLPSAAPAQAMPSESHRPVPEATTASSLPQPQVREDGVEPVTRPAQPATEPLALARPRVIEVPTEHDAQDVPAIASEGQRLPDLPRPAADASSSSTPTVTPVARSQASPAVRQTTARAPSVASGGEPPAARHEPQRPARMARPSLVYLARKPATAAERIPEGMTSYEVPREQLVRMGIAATTNDGVDRGGAGTGTIARAVSVGDVEAAATGGADTAAEGAEPGAEETRGEVNLETLARRVYDRIRNRLRIERERSGVSSGAVLR